MGSSIRLSIVFLNYNRFVETRFTVEKLRDLLDEREDIEVIAVDNGSSDGTGEYLVSQSDFLSPILLPDNRGIGGYTPGFQRSLGDYLLVLDDDSHPESQKTIDHLIKYLDEHPDTGVVACRIEDAAGNRVPSWHLPVKDEAGPSMSFIGCGFAIRRALFQDIGWYPEEFFLYQNEVDVAIKVQIRGFGVHYEPECTVIHRALPSDRPGSRRVYYATRNSLWLIRRYYTWPGRGYLLASRIIIGLIRAVQFAEIRAYLHGIRQGLSKPVAREPLPDNIKARFEPFWRQNSIWHQLTSRA